MHTCVSASNGAFFAKYPPRLSHFTSSHTNVLHTPRFHVKICTKMYTAAMQSCLDVLLNVTICFDFVFQLMCHSEVERLIL